LIFFKHTRQQQDDLK
jgi:hypothetical protein